MAKKKAEGHLEVALVQVAPNMAESTLVGVTRNPRIAAAVHRALRDEMAVSVCEIDGAGDDLDDTAEDETLRPGRMGE